MQADILGCEYEIKQLNDADFLRYRLLILSDVDQVSPTEYLRRATAPAAVKFLTDKMLSEDIEIDEDNAVEIFMDIHQYILNKPVVIDLLSMTGQEQYKQLKRSQNGGSDK